MICASRHIALLRAVETRNARGKSTYNDQNDEHSAKSAHVDRPATEEWKYGITDQNANDEACRNGDVDVERLLRIEPCGFQEDDRVAGQRVSIEDLRGPCHAILFPVSIS